MAALTLKVSANTAKALKHARTLTVTLTATSTAAKHRSRNLAKVITLR
jgi:hypothetical protein